MDKYEIQALSAIELWEKAEEGLLAKAWNIIVKPVEVAGELVMSLPVIKEVLTKSFEGILNMCNDAGSATVRRDAIYEEFRDMGIAVYSAKDIEQLPLEKVDKVVGYLDAKYKSMAALEGAATGVAGLPGLAIDIPALMTLNFRAIGEYATYYGFDITLPQERIYALQLLNCASVSQAGKQAVLMELTKIAKEVAAKKAWKELNKNILVKIIKELAEKVGVNLTKRKLAQAVPAVGGAIGAAFNASYTADVCETAFNCYRKRFLARKYADATVLD